MHRGGRQRPGGRWYRGRRPVTLTHHAARAGIGQFFLRGVGTYSRSGLLFASGQSKAVILLFVTLHMPLNWSFSERTFTFRFDARTSRGPIKSRRSWFPKVVDPKTPEKTGYGECAPLPGLSVEDISGLENVLAGVLEKAGGISLAGDILRQVQDVVPEGFPSITFGMETALLDLKNGGRRLIFDNGFA